MAPGLHVTRNVFAVGMSLMSLQEQLDAFKSELLRTAPSGVLLASKPVLARTTSTVPQSRERHL